MSSHPVDPDGCRGGLGARKRPYLAGIEFAHAVRRTGYNPARMNNDRERVRPMSALTCVKRLVRIAQADCERSGMASTDRNDTDRYVQPRAAGGWEVVKEDHDRASAVTRTQKEAVDRARMIVRNQGDGDVRIKGQDGRFRDSDSQGRNESPAKDRR
jgi:hypothetical protein